ncbi:CSC1-like protein [Tanacetum coccineum]
MDELVLDELDEFNEPMPKGKLNQLQDAEDKLIMIVIFEFLNDNYDVFVNKLRKNFQAYEPFVSIQLLRLILTSTPGSLEGIVSLLNDYFLAIDNGYLLEFWKPHETSPLVDNSHFLGFGESYKDIGRENSSVSGVVVGYTQLKDAINTIIIDCHIPTFANRDRLERWKPHLVIIIVMILEGYECDDTIGNKGKVLQYDDMLADQQAKAEAKADDKANRRKQDGLRSVGPRMAELLSHLGSQNDMGSGSGSGGGSGGDDEGGDDDECFHLWCIYP